MSGRPAVFLDRDGVLNQPRVIDGLPHPPLSAGALELASGVEAACARLAAAGLPLVVVTNQPDIARGTTTRAAVDEIHAGLAAMLPLTAFYLCPHQDADACECRKPAPGLLLGAAADLGLDLGRSVMVGDRWRDVEAGRKAGCATVFVDRRYLERRPDAPDLVVGELAEAVDWILDRVRQFTQGDRAGLSS